LKTQSYEQGYEVQNRQLSKAQQGELDAVLLYRSLAELVKTPEEKQVFLKIASDEGKHAAILKRYTGKTLAPSKTKAFIVTTLYRVFGPKLTFGLLQKGEFEAARNYTSLVVAFPRVQEIIEDEIRHGNLVKAMLA
jgi:rubrerythrin